MSLNEWLLNKQKSSSREMEIDNIIKNLNNRKISTENKIFTSKQLKIVLKKMMS